tara:strand:- start:413 stop:1711 length:1299 start_codon:yes stop_codon:yes gene_type:complete
MALPMLDAMLPTRALAGNAKPAPVRMAYLFVPNGMHMPDWTPEREGPHFELPKILKTMEPIKRDLTVLTGLTNDKGRGNGDGPGDHARSAGVFLTGVQPLKSEGAEIRAGVSVDQVAAQGVGHETRFASLELGTEKGRQSGKCDSGYACSYSNNISWRDATTPMTKETNPRLVFERLFGNQNDAEQSESAVRRRRFQNSILDFVLEDAKRIHRKVGGKDRVKLDEYLTAVREIELRLERAEQDAHQRPEYLESFDLPDGIPSSYEEHIRLMGDMMVLAFQTDMTRIATFMLANEGSNKSYRFIGVNEGHHSLSHHGGDSEKLRKISDINEFHARQVSYILQRLKSIPEGDGSLLDNCMVVYGAGISDGNRHNNENLPILLAGKAGGAIKPGRHLRYHFETPMSNLYLSMLDQMGVHQARFGDSTGPITRLFT